VKQFAGELSINRRIDGVVVIRITDYASGVIVAEVEMTPDQFGNAVTGMNISPANRDGGVTVITYEAERFFGTTQEYKTENVSPIPTDWPKWGNEKTRQEFGSKWLALFEVDGWRGSPEDLFNAHRRNPDGTYKVTFFRHVNEKGEPVV